MMLVHEYRFTPSQGAMRRPATSSSTSVAPLAVKATALACHTRQRGPPAAFWRELSEAAANSAASPLGPSVSESVWEI